MTQFRVTSEDRNGVRYVHVSGEIDLSSLAELDEALRAEKVHVDLSEVTFIDSSGLGCLVETRQRSKTFSLQPSHSVLRIIELSGLDEFFGL